VSVSVEGNVDAGMPHLIPNVCSRLAVGDQLAGEKVAEIVKPPAVQFSAIHNRPPDVSFKPVWINEPVAAPGNTNPDSALPTLRSARSLMTLSVAEMPRSDLRDFGGPSYHSHLWMPSWQRRFETAY
jgi:hypothetical protein